MVLPWVFFNSTGQEEDDMPNNWITTRRYVGQSVEFAGDVSVGVNDLDTPIYLGGGTFQTEGTVLSVHTDANANYQNTSGFDAIAVLTFQNQQSGAATRHLKVYASDTVDTADGTLLWEIGATDTEFFDAVHDVLTSPPLRIPDDKFITVLNVDDSRAGTNNVVVLGTLSLSGLNESPLALSFVVERAV
jgi:hypothetical protein